ncbi:Quinol monooxygenase YgiN [Parapedobacter koreensis]|uniref:Quinol monooxygenase YgiN n=2 Tax=Parapedobacter koreensis TaxID=332977 RepID=A0A1H7TEK2_9SPHI|nr:Quinol monooxygenase YgiN [Parapedobacter koreensis]
MSTVNERITLLVTFHVKADHKEALKNALISDRYGALSEPGNISMSLYEHSDKPDILYLFERWDSRKSLDEHFTKKYAEDVFALNKTALIKPMEILYLHDIAPLPKNEIKAPFSTDTPVDLVVIFKVKDGMQDTFLKQFEKSIAHSRPEAGNIQFFLHTVPGDDKTYVLYERWRSQEAIDFHFAQPYTVELFDMFKSALEQPIEAYLNFITEIK